MQRRRGSEGENWKPHFICCPPFGEGEREPLLPFVLGAFTYAISVGTLSEVMPFPPGQLYGVQSFSFTGERIHKRGKHQLKSAHTS
jgi:hypothetical protein